MKRISCLLAVLSFSACPGPFPVPCSADSDCRGGGVCIEKLCTRPPPDAGGCQSSQCGAAVVITLTAPHRSNALDIPIRATATQADGGTDIGDRRLVVTARDLTGSGDTSTFLQRDDAGLFEGTFVPTREAAWKLVASLEDGGSPSQEVTVDVDRTGPVVELTVLPPPTRVNTADFTQRDPLDLTESVDSFRRDETVEFRVTSNSADADDATIQVTLGSVVLATQPCADAPVCRSGRAPLWLPTMDASRARLRLTALLRDDVGNGVAFTREIPVTRFRWRRREPTGDFKPPGFDGRGGIWLTWKEGAVRLDQDGLVTASPNIPSDVTSPPILSPTNGWLSVLTQPRLDLSTWLNFDSVGAQRGVACTHAGSPGGAIAELTLVETQLPGESTRSESLAANVINNRVSSLQLYRPTAGGCIVAGGHALRPMAANGATLFGGNGLDLSSMSLDGGTLEESPGWPVRLTAPDRAVTAIAVSRNEPMFTTLEGFQTNLESVSTSGLPAVDWRLPTSFVNTSVDFTVGAGDIVFTGESSVCRAARGSTNAPTCVDANARGAPLVGSGGLLYAPTANGLLVLDAATLQTKWSFNGTFNAGLALDCSRDAGVDPTRPGILVVTSGSPATDVYSIAVDSNGLDPSAPWPKYRHDPGNTGNAAVPVSTCN